MFYICRYCVYTWGSRSSSPSSSPTQANEKKQFILTTALLLARYLAWFNYCCWLKIITKGRNKLLQNSINSFSPLLLLSHWPPPAINLKKEGREDVIISSCHFAGHWHHSGLCNMPWYYYAEIDNVLLAINFTHCDIISQTTLAEWAECKHDCRICDLLWQNTKQGTS